MLHTFQFTDIQADVYIHSIIHLWLYYMKNKSLEIWSYLSNYASYYTPLSQF
jgi:hypothetical protein